MSDRESKVRAAVDRMAARIRDGAARSGHQITYDQAKAEARKIAERNERKIK